LGYSVIQNFLKGITALKKDRNIKNKPLIITIISLVVLIVLVLITSGDRTVSWIESAAGAIFSPVQSFASSVSSGIVKFFSELFNTTDLDRENEQLKARIATLEVEVAQLNELKKENERLKELLSYAEETINDEYVTARVIANSGNVWFDTFTLNAGREHGVSVGDPVVNNQGLVGIVSEVGATWCKVRGIIDPQASVGVLVERTRDNGFVRGVLASGKDGNMVELYFLPSGSDLIPGDKIITNGLGSEKIPKGLVIGTVSEVMRVSGMGTNEANAIITPAVDFAHIEDVIIIVGGGD
jgi:rod shape-determining protein MreC